MSSLKTDVSKLKDFGTGAKREEKTGKGRYDLIPGDVMRDIERYAWDQYFRNDSCTFSISDISMSAYIEEPEFESEFLDFITYMIMGFFIPDNEKFACIDHVGEKAYKVNWDSFRKGIYEMRKSLAKHYEAGAIIHGPDNWKKGIKICGGKRGGTFLDSMRRHADQALMGLTDEPHATAAIWNAVGAIWTLRNIDGIFDESDDDNIENEKELFKCDKNLFDTAFGDSKIEPRIFDDKFFKEIMAGVGKLMDEKIKEDKDKE